MTDSPWKLRSSSWMRPSLRRLLGSAPRAAPHGACRAGWLEFKTASEEDEGSGLGELGLPYSMRKRCRVAGSPRRRREPEVAGRARRGVRGRFLDWVEWGVNNWISHDKKRTTRPKILHRGVFFLLWARMVGWANRAAPKHIRLAGPIDRGVE
jgi:hypothetical protein